MFTVLKDCVFVPIMNNASHIAKSATGEDAAYFEARWCDGQTEVHGAEHWSSDNKPYCDTIGRLSGGWSWDGITLQAQVDEFGFCNLFCYEKDGVVALSPSLLRLVAEGCDTTPDKRALAVFHRLGIFINDDTPLKYIRTLPPNARLRWREGTLTIAGGAPVPKVQTITRDGAIEGMIALFRDSMERTLAAVDGPLRLPLSGGRDSRHILLEMMDQGRRPETCVTFHHNGTALNREAQAARVVCVRLGVTHHILGHARPRLADTVRTLALTGLCADEHAQMMPLHDYFLQHGGIGFDGIAGDILTNPDNDADRFFRLADKGDFRGIARGMMAGHGRVVSQSGWSRGAGPIYSDGMDEEVADYVGTAIEAYADAPDPYQMFWFYHRTRREINFVPQGILSKAEQVFCPYLDSEFARFCLSLPYSVTCDQELHNDAMKRAYPDMADIPFQEGFTEPAMRRGSLGHKLRGVAGAWKIASVLAPDARVEMFGAFVRAPEKLLRGPADVNRLHALCLKALDAEKAANLLNFAAQLQTARPRALISDEFIGSGQN